MDMRDNLEKYKLLMETERADQEAFRSAVLADKKRGVSKKSPYTLGYTGQVWALARREFQKRMQDRFQLITSFATSWVSVLTSFRLIGAEEHTGLGVGAWRNVLQPSPNC